MRDGLGPVHEHDGPLPMGQLDHGLDRIDRAQRVRHVGDGDQSRPRVQRFLERIERHLARIIDRHHAQLRPGLLAHHLPRHDVGVMLQPRDHDLVPGGESAPTVRLGDEVDGLGRAPHEDDFLAPSGPDQALDRLACPLVGLRGPHAEFMDAAVNVGVVLGVVATDRVDHAPGLLRCGGVVQIDQRATIDRLLEDRKLATNTVDVQIGCRTRRMRLGHNGFGNTHIAS